MINRTEYLETEFKIKRWDLLFSLFAFSTSASLIFTFVLVKLYTFTRPANPRLLVIVSAFFVGFLTYVFGLISLEMDRKRRNMINEG